MIEVISYWAGGFYLLNKIFFLFAELSKNEKNIKKWRISSWAVYLIGLPAWVYFFITERNWIAAFIEAGGAPAMIIGLIIALKGVGEEPKWLDNIARVAIVIGLALSIYDFGGINTINQALEIGIVIGFLAGTYMLAQEKVNGYLWFILMNGSNATLMYVQSNNFLMWQQIISLAIVISAYFVKRSKQKSLS